MAASTLHLFFIFIMLQATLLRSVRPLLLLLLPSSFPSSLPCFAFHVNMGDCDQDGAH